MARNSRLLAFVLCMSTVSLLATASQAAEPTFALDARVTLDACRTAVEARLTGVLVGTRTLAATEEVRSGEWDRMRAPLGVLADSVKENAAVWFARPDGSYFTVEKGLTGESLLERAYFPDLLAGRDVIGSLVVSKSTGKRSLIVASPVLADGKVSGVVGVSLDAAQLAASLEQGIRWPSDVVFYALDSQGRTALHRTGELIFAFPSDIGSPTLADAVKVMLSKPEGVVDYQYAGNDRTALFERSALTGWIFVLGKAHVQAVRP